MNRSSLGKFQYALRPAKNIERKMFCEAFSRLSRIAPLSTYRYIGFGSTEFCDFRLFHERLGIKDMLSIEGRIDAIDRVEFNRPYSCIKLKPGVSHTVLPTLSWPHRAIVWLDYDSRLNKQKLADISLIAGVVKSGSLLLVSLPVEPGDASGTDAVNRRLEALKDEVGAHKVPPSIEAHSLSNWGYAKACREIIHNEILQTISVRSAPLPSPNKLEYFQLFNFHYADGMKMLTVGGIFLDDKDRTKFIVKDHYRDLEYICLDESVYRIETPILTLRELRYLDKRLPRSATFPRWLPEDERKKYRKIYRYYPNYTEVEAK